MVPEMVFEEIRKLYHAAPFKPFDIMLGNGRAIAVEHPDFMALSPDEDVVVVFESDGHLTIDVPLIAALKERRNGSGTPKRNR